MTDRIRGADLVVQALVASKTQHLFTLSGNQIMPVFDASIETDIKLIHIRHEAAAVHMADAWGRLTGRPGVALVTAGPGFANILSALYVAQRAESPLVVLSGHAPLSRLGQGPFQEMEQAEMARHVVKASWTVSDASHLGHDIARAFQLAATPRPGPVHLSLPVDLLEAMVEHHDEAIAQVEQFQPLAGQVDDAAIEKLCDHLAAATRPLVLAGPAMMRSRAFATLSTFADSANLPVVGMESPRGVNDPSLGAFAEILPQADTIVLLGKKLDFTLWLEGAPARSNDCRIIQFDPDQESLELTRRVVDDPSRLLACELADPTVVAERFVELTAQRNWPTSEWRDKVQSAICYQPPDWQTIETPQDGSIHAVEVCRAVQELLSADDQAVFISDGGEFGQWAQACIRSPHRIINGPSGAIGSAIPFALAARLAMPESRIVTMLGDGTFGFHPAEFDTAVRYGLPFIAVVGNDATWNAEYQIQLRKYGSDRTVGCELLPTRYDKVVAAFGGHGEHVSRAGEIESALERAFQSGLPACVNVGIERIAAPVIRRG